MKEIIGSRCDERGKIFKEVKILESLNHPNLVNFKNGNITSHSQLCLNMYHLVFPPLEQLVKFVDWMGFKVFSIIFRLK